MVLTPQWQLVAVHKPGRKTKVSHLPTVKARCQVEIRTQMLKRKKEELPGNLDDIEAGKPFWVEA